MSTLSLIVCLSLIVIVFGRGRQITNEEGIVILHGRVDQTKL